MAATSLSPSSESLKSESLKVGTTVIVRWGLQNVRGIITEDRGPIGIGGRRLYRVDADLGEGSPLVMELPALEIESVKE